MTETLRLGIAGLGTVGMGVMRLLEQNRADVEKRAGSAIAITGVSARDKARERGLDLGPYAWFDDPRALAESGGIDIFVELIGGEEGVANEAVERALATGKHVVTANKAMLAHHGYALAALAEKSGVALNFEAAVAGGIPIVKVMRESLLGNRVSRVYGIMNGTCNYILTRMEEEGRFFGEVLGDAQAAGYAEADPTHDIGGHDTAHKLALLTSLAFGTKPSFEAVYIEGIQQITPTDIEAADSLGYRIKLLGVAQQTESGIEQRVHPTMVPKHSALAEVDGVYNCVAVDGNFIGTVMLVGLGAGANPTASSVVGDIIDIARGKILPPFIQATKELLPYKQAAMRTHEGGYYIRLSVYDRSGAFAAIAQRMADLGISLESIVQRRPGSELPGIAARGEAGAPAPVVMITHQTSESAIRKALDKIEADGHVDEKPQMIRIENL